MPCTVQWESVLGLPPRDGTVKCVDRRPCSRALCGLGLFICEPDLPMRGGGGGVLIEKRSNLGDALETKLTCVKWMQGETVDPHAVSAFQLKELPGS